MLKRRTSQQMDTPKNDYSTPIQRVAAGRLAGDRIFRGQSAYPSIGNARPLQVHPLLMCDAEQAVHTLLSLFSSEPLTWEHVVASNFFQQRDEWLWYKRITCRRLYGGELEWRSRGRVFPFPPRTVGAFTRFLLMLDEHYAAEEKQSDSKVEGA